MLACGGKKSDSDSTVPSDSDKITIILTHIEETSRKILWQSLDISDSFNRCKITTEQSVKAIDIIALEMALMSQQCLIHKKLNI